MTANNTESLGANSSSETRSVFYCPKLPHFIWDLNHTTSLMIVLVVTTIACPVTILLNLLAIIAVNTRRELHKNSNIFLSRLAVTDFLVGAVSMPLTITLDALVLQRILFEDVICTIDIISGFVLNTVCLVSFLHLVLISWDRYMAIVKWMDYKVTVTRDRVKKYTAAAWLLPLVPFTSAVIAANFGIPYEVLLVISVLISTFWVVCFLFIIYCYVNVYLVVRKQNKAQIRSVNAMARAKLERKIAYTTFWITLFVCISGLPIPVVHLFGGIWPFLHKSSIFRPAEVIVQLNSLVNPLLYFYRNRQLRKAALELLRCRKPQRIQPVSRTVRRMRRRRYSVASQDVREPQIGQKRPRLKRSKSCDAVMCSDTIRRRSDEQVRGRPISAPLTVVSDKEFVQQPNKVLLIVQVEDVPTRRHIQRNTESPKDIIELELRTRYHITRKIVRSTSLNETSFFTVTNCHQKTTKEMFLRSRSLPILSNLNTLDNKLTVTEWTSETETEQSRGNETLNTCYQ